MARTERELAAELAKPSFTPAVRDAPALVELVAQDDPRAAAALGKLGEAGRTALAARLGEPDDGARARLVAALGIFARGGDAAARGELIARLGDGSPRVRRAAANALGKLSGDDVRAALIARWDATDVTPDERRVLAEALGKLGGDAAIARLRALAPGDDAELARRRDRALLMAERSAKRDEDSAVLVDVPPPSPLVVRLRCKRGLAPLLVEQLGGTQIDDAAVELVLDRPWASLFASRLWMTAGIRVPAALPADGVPQLLCDHLVSAIVAQRGLLAAWTRGPIRWRLAVERGHQRAVVWRVAKQVSERAPELINDPSNTTWDIVVDGDMLELVPRRAPDPRFSWRVAEVPAASHPTVAAALALVAGAQPGDRVWDPFAGSGAELVERAQLGPCASLIGSDRDPAALDAARANTAGLTVRLELADARTFAPGPVDLIITNPPLGSRIRLDAAELLAAALPHFARQLAPRGRLVWITPAERRTTAAAERAGLRRTRALAVDLGGVHGQLERWERV